MDFNTRKKNALKSLFISLVDLSKSEISRFREKEQDKLTEMSVNLVADRKAFCDNDDILIQSYIVDELLCFEVDNHDLDSKIGLLDDSLRHIV